MDLEVAPVLSRLKSDLHKRCTFASGMFNAKGSP